MSLRATVLETVQIGKEFVAGEAVAADKRIQSFDLDAEPQIPISMVSPQGWKAPTESTQEKEWTLAAINGSLCFETAAYLFCSILQSVDPETPAANGIWTVTVTGGPGGGTFTLTFGGQTTSALDFDASVAEVLAALEALSTIGAGNVGVTALADGGPYTVSFQNALAGVSGALTADGSGLTGGTLPDVTTASTGATATRRWTFVPSMTAEDEFQTFTVEKGQGTNGQRFTFASLIELALDFVVRSAGMKGQFIGQELEDGATMTPDPTDIEVKPVSPNTLSVYIGNTVLGLEKLLQCYKASWSVKERRKARFTLEEDEPSFSGLVEGAFQQAGMILIEQDENVANDLMDDLRNKQTKLVRIVMHGPQIESGYRYRIQITFSCRLTQPKRQDDEGVFSGEFMLEPVVSHDFPSDGANGVVEVVLDNTVAAL